MPPEKEPRIISISIEQTGIEALIKFTNSIMDALTSAEKGLLTEAAKAQIQVLSMILRLNPNTNVPNQGVREIWFRSIIEQSKGTTKLLENKEPQTPQLTIMGLHKYSGPPSEY